MQRAIDKEFKNVNRKTIDKASTKIAESFRTIRTAGEFMDLITYIDSLPALERRFMTMRLLTGTMMFFMSTELLPAIDKERTKGIYR